MGLDRSGVVPKSGHFVIRSKSAVSEGYFGARLSPEEILANIEFSELLPNKDPFDPDIRYFHMFGSTKNHIVLPFLSVIINPSKMLELIEYEATNRFIRVSRCKSRVSAFQIKFKNVMRKACRPTVELS